MAKKLRILLFDDDAVVLQLLTLACTRRGYDVRAFPDPIRCDLKSQDVCRCQMEEPCADAIISDLHMPGMTGLEFAEAQRAKGCKCAHIALVSGRWSAAEVARASRLGCKLFAKPFHISQIDEWLDAVEEAVAGQS